MTPQTLEKPGKTDTQPSVWRDRIAASVQRRTAMLKDWRDNVAYRMQKPFTQGGLDADTVAVPEDWARSKQKAAQLMFQVPKIVAFAKQPKFEGVAPIVQEVANHKLVHEVRAENMLDECLADVINAAGFMVSMVGVDTVTEPTEVPAVDISQYPPEVQATLLQSKQVPMDTVERTVYRCYYWRRISPAAFLYPAEFTGSDWDEAPWLGYETWMPLEQVKKQYAGKLPNDFKCSSGKPELLSESVSETPEPSSDYVKLQVIWYKGYLYRSDVKHPEALYKIVFAEGHDQPLEDGPTSWQEYVEPEIDQEIGEEIPGHYVGIRKFPIRVGTLTYISDLATPPSDTQAGRPQVRELIRSRSQMLRQRDRSIPIRWFDTNRLDTDVANKLQNGEWQDMIPVNGPGERVVGEVARAQYPRENFEFQTIIGGDLDRAWSLSNTQLASALDSGRSATEVNLMQSAAQTRLEYEKARVSRYIIGGVDVLMGLIQLFTDRTEYVQIVGADGEKKLAAWDRDKVQGEFVFDIVPDSGDRLDPAVRQERLLKLYNLAANDPTINRPFLTKELVKAFGMDPATVLTTPPEPKPEAPNVSYRFAGQDLLNPLVVAVMQQAHPVTPDEIAAAKKLIEDATGVPGAPEAPPAGAPGGEPPMDLPLQQAPPEDVEPPETQEPILKRAADGSRM